MHAPRACKEENICTHYETMRTLCDTYCMREISETIPTLHTRSQETNEVTGLGEIEGTTGYFGGGVITSGLGGSEEGTEPSATCPGVGTAGSVNTAS